MNILQSLSLQVFLLHSFIVWNFLRSWHKLVYSALLIPRCILRLPWLRVFRAFPSVVRQMPGYTSQRRGTVRALHNWWTVLFRVLFVCKCVLYYCQKMVTQLQLNIYHITSYHIIYIIPYHISYHIIYHIVYHITSHHISYVVSCRVVSCRVLSCHVM
jgi:hypothetical protein